MDAPVTRRPTAGQRALAEALARGEASLGERIERLSTDRYLDDSRHAAEIRGLFGQGPLPLVPSALLPEAAMAVTHDDYGEALIVTRDIDGAPHVLANACRHRGTRLLETDEVVSAKRIACPYHAWTYKVDGRLVGLPRPDTFPGFDKAEHGLQAYPCHESAGLIWFSRDPSEHFEEVDRLAEDFLAIGLDRQKFFRRRTHDVAANWKLVIDAFLESYHVQRLHAGSIAEFFADGIAVADEMGAHQRFAVGRADYAAKIDLDDWPSVRQVMTFTYQLFPNAVLIFSPDYVNLLVVHPTSVDRCRVTNFMTVPREECDGEMRERWERSWRLLDESTFGGEDFRAAALCQQGLAASDTKEMLLGTLEHAITFFHERVDAAVQAAEGA
ncbi:aromatic ring-hydroxylating oxygenase subunit alpha [Sphingomicrobium nitratireducens]|uniref:aromatic ring-hydroxylating oxygenase subunit alpha n=1 Tax=Sphingomicrobium nitratireducens TaxID=2964666 RepID=UPI002240C8C2|nr:aromatic ring-hydroxylating dioxygenase subunit alpha [Sphingomicrobium nitratireducens]